MPYNKALSATAHYPSMLSAGAARFGMLRLVVNCVQMTNSLIWAAFHLIGVYFLAKYACEFSTPQAVFLTVFGALSIEASYLMRSAAK
jgi:hypothetical protein